jgi:tetratricopeptide (TPR) repeat protein
VVGLFEKAGTLAAAAGELDMAIAHFTLCMDLSFPPSESVLYARACAYQRKGMWKEAKADFARLVELRPSNARYKKGKKDSRRTRATAAAVPEFYKVLGLSVDARMKDIKRAFKKLALSTHPDKVEEEDEEASTDKFRRISEAYLTLSDIEKRRAYDEANNVFENEEEEQQK